MPDIPISQLATTPAVVGADYIYIVHAGVGYKVPVSSVLAQMGVLTSVTASTPLTVGGTAQAPIIQIPNPLPVANGGTGSTTQSFVDTSSAQIINGVKTVSNAPVLSFATGSGTAALTVDPAGNVARGLPYVDTSTAQAISGLKTFVSGASVPPTTGYSIGAQTIFSGSGAPATTPPTGSLYLRSDTGTLYSYNGSSWQPVQYGSSSTQNVQQAVAIAYTATGSETTGAPGTFGTITFGALPTSPLTNWRIFVDVLLQASAASNNSNLGIGTATAGTTQMALFGTNNTATHTITGGNCVSDVVVGSFSVPAIACSFAATYAAGTTPSFSAIGFGVNWTVGTKIWGVLRAIALPV